MPEALCVNCHSMPIRKRRRCAPCAAYLMRTGHDRPEDVIVAYGLRIMAQLVG